MKIQAHSELREEMKAVARGERPAPANAAQPSVESVEVLVRLLTSENRDLLRLIRDERPPSVAALARLSHRAEPNLRRTLAKLESIGLIEMRPVGRHKMPMPRVAKLRIEIDPYRRADTVDLIAG